MKTYNVHRIEEHGFLILSIVILHDVFNGQYDECVS